MTCMILSTYEHVAHTVLATLDVTILVINHKSLIRHRSVKFKSPIRETNNSKNVIL